MEYYYEHIDAVINEAKHLLVEEKRIPVLIITDKVIESDEDSLKTSGELCSLVTTSLSRQDRIALLKTALAIEENLLAELN